MRCKVLFVLPLTILLSTSPSMAGDFTFAKFAGEFLALGAGGRSMGMGSAYVSVARDVTSGYWNPAGLAYLDYPQFMLMHSSQFSGIVNYDYGAFGIPVGRRSSLGFSVIRVGVDDIQRTRLLDPDRELGEEFERDGQIIRNVPIADGTFGATDYALFLTYAKRVSETFSYGGNVKIVHKSLDSNSAWGAGFDFGILFNPFSRVILGLNLQDITTTVLAWDTGRRELITPALRTGLSYPIALSTLGGSVQPSIDFVFRFENRDENSLVSIGRNSLDVNLGWEYTYRESIALRFGLTDFGQSVSESNRFDVGRFTAGVGLHFPKLAIDYAFLGHEDLGSTHRISARLTLEEPKFLRQK